MIQERISGSGLHEQLARERKVRILATFLHDEFIRVLEALDDDSWLNCAARAGVNKPSEESKKLVIQVLRDRRP